MPAKPSAGSATDAHPEGPPRPFPVALKPPHHHHRQTVLTIKNAHTGGVLAQVQTLSQARSFCDQRLLRSAASREGFLSNLASGIITVYDASNTCYRGVGF